MSRWVELLHVGVAFWFVAGLLGRNLTLARARASERLELVVDLVGLARRFDRLLVIPGSAAVVLLGLLTALAQHRPLAGPGNGWLLASLLLAVALIALVPLVFVPRRRWSSGRSPTPDGAAPSPRLWRARSPTRWSRPPASWSWWSWPRS